MIWSWRENYLVFEGLLAAGASAAFIAWDMSAGQPAVDALLLGNRAAVYGALAATSGSLFGFSITAIAIFISFAPVDPFRQLAEHAHYPSLWRIYKGAMRWLAASTVAAIVALIADRDALPRHWALYFVVLTHAFAIARLARSVWSLEQVVDIMTTTKR